MRIEICASCEMELQNDILESAHIMLVVELGRLLRGEHARIGHSGGTVPLLMAESLTL